MEVFVAAIPAAIFGAGLGAVVALILKFVRKSPVPRTKIVIAFAVGGYVLHVLATTLYLMLDRP